VLIFIVGYQQVENMVLSPRITSRTMALHLASASVQALVSSYLHRYEVVASPPVGSSG
jgi:hypothetical protein